MDKWDTGKDFLVRLSFVYLPASRSVCLVETFIASMTLLWSLPLAILVFLKQVVEMELKMIFGG